MHTPFRLIDPKIRDKIKIINLWDLSDDLNECFKKAALLTSDKYFYFLRLFRNDDYCSIYIKKNRIYFLRTNRKFIVVYDLKNIEEKQKKIEEVYWLQKGI